MKRILFLGLVFCLGISSAANAAVDISLECRMANRPPGLCGWCAIETLARHHGIKALYGLVERNSSQCGPADIERAVAAREVKYHIQQRGKTSTQILRYAIRNNLGAVVGFRPVAGGNGGHIVTLVDFGPEEIRYIDSNYPDRVRMMDLETFLERWDGFALVLDRP